MEADEDVQAAHTLLNQLESPEEEEGGGEVQAQQMDEQQRVMQQEEQQQLNTPEKVSWMI